MEKLTFALTDAIVNGRFVNKVPGLMYCIRKKHNLFAFYLRLQYSFVARIIHHQKHDCLNLYPLLQTLY
jgi:hypothetical protein